MRKVVFNIEINFIYIEVIFMSNIKKITSVFATLFCMGQSAVVNASTKEASVKPMSATNELLNFNKKDDGFLNPSSVYGVDDKLKTQKQDEKYNVYTTKEMKLSAKTPDSPVSATNEIIDFNTMDDDFLNNGTVYEVGDRLKTKKQDEEYNVNNTNDVELSSLSTEADESDVPLYNPIENDSNAVKSDSNRVHKEIRKNYSLNKRIKNPGRTFLFNFRGTDIRPTDNLLDGEKIYYPNVPDFDGLINCGITKDLARAFYDETQLCKCLKNETWKRQYGDNLAWQTENKVLNNELNTLSAIVKEQAVNYYKTSINRDENINRLRNYSSALGNGIDKLIEALENSDWSNEDKKEIDSTIKEYNENPKIKLLWYNKTDAFPLRNVIIKLGEAKIIHLYTKLLLKVIDEIENTDNLLIDDLYQHSSDGETEKNVDVIKDKIMQLILNKQSTVSKKLDEELSKMVLSSDGFFDKFNDYENYKKETNLNRSNKPIIGRVN